MEEAETENDSEETLSFEHSRAAAIGTHRGYDSMLETCASTSRANPSMQRGVRHTPQHLAVGPLAIVSCPGRAGLFSLRMYPLVGQPLSRRMPHIQEYLGCTRWPEGCFVLLVL